MQLIIEIKVLSDVLKKLFLGMRVSIVSFAINKSSDASNNRTMTSSQITQFLIGFRTQIQLYVLLLKFIECNANNAIWLYHFSYVSAGCINVFQVFTER